MKQAILTIYVLGFCIFTLAQSTPVNAHSFDYGVIKTNLTIQEYAIKLHTEVPQQIGANPEDGDVRILYEKYLSENLILRNDEQLCPFKLTNYVTTSSPNQSIFDGVFTCQSTVGTIDSLTIHSQIFSDFFTNFDHFVTISGKDRSEQFIFTATKLDYPEQAQKKPDNSAQKPTSEHPHSADQQSKKSFFELSRQFLIMGIQHIWTGYDHILFLLSAILLLRSIKKILVVVTSFTVAHTITLLLAGFKIITISPHIVEPLIASTIVFVAIRNLSIVKTSSKQNQLSERWLLTGGFGLIHGLGFAGALLATGLPQDYFVSSLIFFNVGIELGQLSILLILVPLLLWIDKRRWGMQALCYISETTIILASIWLVQRLF